MKKQVKFNTFNMNFNPLVGITMSTWIICLLGLIALLTNMHPVQIIARPGYTNLKYYSGILAIASFIYSLSFSILLILKKKGRQIELPRWFNVINVVITSQLVLNFFLSVCYMIPIYWKNETNHFSWVITGSNLIFNVIVPILYVIQFCFLLKNNKVKYIDSLYSLIPISIYAIIYIILVSANPNNDWYKFNTNVNGLMYLAFGLMIGLSIGLSCLLIFLSRLKMISGNGAKLALSIMLFVFATIGLFWTMYYGFTDDDTKYTKFERILKRLIGASNLSNFIIWIIVIMSIIFYSLVQANRIKSVPDWFYVLKQAAIVFITVVFLAEAFACFYHLFTSKLDTAINTMWRRLYRKHLIFTHFLTPIAAMLIFIFVEHKVIKFRYTFVSASIMGGYVLAYTVALYCHIHDEWSEGVIWDQYNVLKILSYKTTWILPFIGYGIGYALSIIFRLINKKVDNFYLLNKKNNYKLSK